MTNDEEEKTLADNDFVRALSRLETKNRCRAPGILDLKMSSLRMTKKFFESETLVRRNLATVL